MTISEMLKEFHRTFGEPPDDIRWHLKWKLLREEMQELNDELVDYEVGKSIGIWVAKEMADVAYVLWGLALEMGIDMEAAVAAVHTSNMSKVGADGTVVRRKDGKILKGPNYQPPDMSIALRGGQS